MKIERSNLHRVCFIVNWLMYLRSCVLYTFSRTISRHHHHPCTFNIKVVKSLDSGWSRTKITNLPRWTIKSLYDLEDNANSLVFNLKLSFASHGFIYTGQPRSTIAGQPTAILALLWILVIFLNLCKACKTFNYAAYSGSEEKNCKYAAVWYSHLDMS